MEAGGQRAEQRHREVLGLYADLRRQQQEASAQSREEGVEPWLSGLLDQQLTQLRRRLDEERQQREQVRYWTHQDVEIRDIRNITKWI